MKKQIKIEIEVIDDEHCSDKCYYFTHLFLNNMYAPPYCTITKSKYWRKLKQDRNKFLRTDKCKQAEVK